MSPAPASTPARPGGLMSANELSAAMVSPPAPASRKGLWAGRIITGVMSLFLVMDAAMKLLQPPAVVERVSEVGWTAGSLTGLGILMLVLLALYLIPKTAILGAVLWTGYLGGAVATHVRVGQPLFSAVLVPVYVGGLLWLGLWLRDEKLRAMLPLR